MQIYPHMKRSIKWEEGRDDSWPAGPVVTMGACAFYAVTRPTDRHMHQRQDTHHYAIQERRPTLLTTLLTYSGGLSKKVSYDNHCLARPWILSPEANSRCNPASFTCKYSIAVLLVLGALPCTTKGSLVSACL